MFEKKDPLRHLGNEWRHTFHTFQTFHWVSKLSSYWSVSTTFKTFSRESISACLRWYQCIMKLTREWSKYSKVICHYCTNWDIQSLKEKLILMLNPLSISICQSKINIIQLVWHVVLCDTVTKIRQEYWKIGDKTSMSESNTHGIQYSLTMRPRQTFRDFDK